jgi:hypothetical protein
MKLTIKEGSTNYACTVVEIKQIFDIEGADNIKRVVVEGNNVVVSKDTKVGDVMLYFVSGTRLNKDFCFKNDLYDKPEENINTDKKGYISHRQQRVKAIKLRGIVSDGMLMPLHSLISLVGNYDFKIGDAFTDVNDVSICEKYITPSKTAGQPGSKVEKVNKLASLIVDNQFKFHFETSHFVKHEQYFTPETEVIITRKMHGSSLILAKVLVNKKLSFLNKLLLKLGVNIPISEHGVIWSSGKPKSKLPKGIESESNKWDTPNQSFYTSDIWARAYKEIGHTLEKGISIYAEIVGNGIQGDGYTYGKDYAIYVYRVTSTSVDGVVHEFSWEQVKKYCEKYGLTPVEEYFVGKVKEMTTDNLLEYLKEKYLDKSYPDCKVDEGICIRVRATDEIFKLKSPLFILGENAEAEQGVENIEDAQ